MDLPEVVDGLGGRSPDVESVPSGSKPEKMSARKCPEREPVAIHSENGEIRPLNVVMSPKSPVAQAYARRACEAEASTAPVMSDGFRVLPKWDLVHFGGKTIADLVFVNRYVGGEGAWDRRDIQNIDAALAAAMSDSRLQSVIAQYYPSPITSRMLEPSRVVPGYVPPRFFKDDAEELASRLFLGGDLDESDPEQSVINLMLPRGVVLVDGFSPSFRPPPGMEEENGRRRRALIKVDDDESDSTHGLGGYHGSVHVNRNGQDVTVYYAVGVFSEGDNGIAVFDGANGAWQNVVATFYHELNEARTDPDVEDAIRLNDVSKIGWYSPGGNGEIGDLPIKEVESAPRPDIGRVFTTVPLEQGSGGVPIQLMWSNKAHAPALSL
ncbi:hypothetical protein AB0L59_01620 [Streptomyces sp. NPDC052109]|uniref:hypothetical protein n=1 Tax=Streptomyces sp. NPDC052109 TaxID=3155527 RepID=UPI00342B23EF